MRASGNISKPISFIRLNVKQLTGFHSWLSIRKGELTMALRGLWLNIPRVTCFLVFMVKKLHLLPTIKSFMFARKCFEMSELELSVPI